MIIGDEEVTFAPRRFRIVTELTAEMPPVDNVTAAHCLGFDDAGQFLLTRHVDREWTIPGGHREPGESPEEAMRRETVEEAAAIVDDPVLFATDRIELLEGEPDPRYPIPSFQVFFIARVVTLDALVPNAECLESRLFAVDEARALPGWMDHNQRLFAPALELARHRWFARE